MVAPDGETGLLSQEVWHLCDWLARIILSGGEAAVAGQYGGSGSSMGNSMVGHEAHSLT